MSFSGSLKFDFDHELSFTGDQCSSGRLTVNVEMWRRFFLLLVLIPVIEGNGPGGADVDDLLARCAPLEEYNCEQLKKVA